MFEGLIASKLANKMFEKDVFKIVKKHAFWGSLCMILPTGGLEVFIFIFVLWHMYSSICKKVGTTLKTDTIIVGLIVNSVIAFILDIVFMIIPFLTCFVIYAQFYFSGKAYIETLKSMK